MNKDFWERIGKLEELTERATKGEWKVIHGSEIVTESGVLIADVVVPPLGHDAEKVAEIDAKYIATANPAMIKEMIKMIKLQKRIS